jgi:hypothetical protein
MPSDLPSAIFEREMLVYVAGSTKDIERVQHVQRHCTDRGWLIAFDWTRAEGNMPDGVWDNWPELGAEIAEREVNACSSADLTILLSPAGGLGCWIEMGCTLAAGGEVWVVEPYRDSVFWQHPLVRRFDTFDALMATLTEPMADAA